MFEDWFRRFMPNHGMIVRELESPTAVFLGLMKYNGVPVDIGFMAKRKAEADAEMDRIREEIAFIIGDVPIGANCSTNAFKKYLFQDLGLPVLRWTDSGHEAVDDTAMTLLKEWCEKKQAGAFKALPVGAGVPPVGQDQVNVS